jgi:hypothetical protein
MTRRAISPRLATRTLLNISLENEECAMSSEGLG